MTLTVEGVYYPPKVYEDCADEQEARRRFHDEHPGFHGAIWRVRAEER